MKSIIEQIKQDYKTLSKGHRHIADFILSHPEEAACLTASKMGEEAKVSESTVVRFAVEMGFLGFPQFQKYLKEDLKANLTSVQRMKMSSTILKKQSDVLGYILMSDQEHIKQAYETRNTKAFDEAVDVILKANRVYILGLRSTAALASFLYYHAKHILNHVSLLDSISGMELVEQLVGVKEGDVVICLSFPRYTKRIIKALTFSKKSGAKTVMITDKLDNPFSQYSDYSIIAPSDMVSFVDSLTVPFSTITALIVALTVRSEETVIKHLERLESIWKENEVYEKDGKGN